MLVEHIGPFVAIGTFVAIETLVAIGSFVAVRSFVATLDRFRPLLDLLETTQTTLRPLLDHSRPL